MIYYYGNNRNFYLKNIGEIDVLKGKSIFDNLMQIVSIISVILFIVFYILFNKTKVMIFEIIYITSIIIAYHFIIRLVIGNIIPRFKSRINYKSNWFKTKDFELKIYKKLNVKNWKDKVPTFDPQEYDMENLTLEQLIVNMCNSEWVHETNFLFSYPTLLFSMCFGKFYIFLITAILASFMDLIFVMIQRYNRPRIMKLLERENKIKSKS